MRSLRVPVVLSTLVVVASMANAEAQTYGGRVLLPEIGQLNVPIGVNETGRYARFVTDARFDENQIQMTNRDFENWKPLDARSKEKMMHFMRGNLRTSYSPVPDQETGRFSRFVVDPRFDFNNLITENRDFVNFKVNGAASKNYMLHYLRGLPVAYPVIQARPVAVRVPPLPLQWY